MVPIMFITGGAALGSAQGIWRYAVDTLHAEAEVVSDTSAVVPSTYNPYIPVSPFAIGILKLLSTGAALYLSLLVLLNIEVLMLFPLVLKQKGYSYLYKELGTPVVGPVFMTQIRKLAPACVGGMLANVYDRRERVLFLGWSVHAMDGGERCGWNSGRVDGRARRALDGMQRALGGT
jgi:hypothetical protein